MSNTQSGQSEFPPFNPHYRNEAARDEYRSQDHEWYLAFHTAWIASHDLSDEEQKDWKFWATRLYTNKSTSKLCNHAVGKAGGTGHRPITWANIAAVMANPRWNKIHILMVSDWAKRAQTKFPTANIFAGHPNANGPAITDLILSTEKRAPKQQHQAANAESHNGPESTDTDDIQMTADADSHDETMSDETDASNGDEELKAEIRELRTENEALNERCERFEAQNNEVHDLLSDVWDTSRARLKEISRLKEMVESFEGTVESLKGTVESLEGTVESLRATLSAERE